VNLAELSNRHPVERPALVSRGRTFTYGDLRDRVDRFRGGLIRLGLRPGDRIGLLCANNDRFVVAYLAGLGAGLVVVPLNPLSPGPELTDELRRVSPRAVVVGPAARRSFAHVQLDEVGTLEFVISAGESLGPGTMLVDEVSDGAPEPIVERGPDDPAVLVFTSGTAGSPQACILTHGNLSAALQSMLAIAPDLRRPDDVALGVVPLFHIFGLSVILNLALATGSCIVLVERFDPTTAVESIARHGITMVSGPPTLWSALASLPEVSPADFATVRIAVSGAAKLDPAVYRLVRDRLGVEIREGYGLTETSATVTTALHTDAPAGSVGRPMPGVELRLVDPDGNDVLVNDPGEVWVRGPMVTPGYWNDAPSTEAALTPEGWLRTGDLAVVDDDGWLRVVDRAKDLIIVSGFNVFPAEVEGVLLQHPDIDQVAVVGVSHPHSGEAVRAHVVLRPGAHLDEDDVIAWAAGRLAGYKCPSKVLFADTLPTGMTGKVLRRELS
jgi:long-chain acyl-CoA synthetase